MTSPNEKQLFSARLIRARNERQMGVKTLAERTGLSISAIRSLEAGNQEPKAGTLYALCGVLGLDMTYLWRGGIPGAGEILPVFGQLTEERRRDLLAIAVAFSMMERGVTVNVGTPYPPVVHVPDLNVPDISLGFEVTCTNLSDNEIDSGALLRELDE